MLHAQSGGLFDITAGALTRLWDRPQQTLPDAADIAAARARVGWEHVYWRRPQLRLDLPGLRLDLGGLVKEYAADRAAQACIEAGIEAGVVELGGDVRVIGGYFPNGQEPGSDKFDYKMNWLKGLRDWVRTELQACPRMVIMGDYNITFDDADVWDPVGLKDTIHCTEEERYHLRALIAMGFHDSFRLFEQPAKSYSWWDYRDFGFRRNRGLRIDHILVSNALRPLVKGCLIDKTPRKNERPSDHAPVMAELDLL